MAKRSLRAQLNQIRAWVQQGRTDAWIAHQLEVPAAELREFRRRHKLTPDEGEASEVDLRDEIEAEIEAAALAAEEEEAELDEEDEAELDEGEGEEDAEGERGEEAPARRPRAAQADTEGERGEEGDERPRRRRRRRRRGRGRGRRGLEGTFEHGEGVGAGYGVWLDPAIAQDPAYTENWRGHRSVQVEVEADRITIRRAESNGDD